METIITEWNTLVRLGENLWLKIEEPRDQKTPEECNITVHYTNPNSDEDSDIEDEMEIGYEYHKEQYDDQQGYDDDDDDEE